MKARRGHREKVESGIYRNHRLSCSLKRCECPFAISVPGDKPGSTRTLTITGSLKDARAAKHNAQAVGRTPAPVKVETVGSFAQEWLEAGRVNWSPGYYSLKERSYRTFIKDRWGDIPLKSLNRREVQTWATGLISQGIGRRAVEHSIETLRAICGKAVELCLIESNPAMRIKLPPKPVQERTPADRVINLNQSARLYQFCTLREETIIRAALEAGLRRGEIAGLQWSDVLLTERRILIRRSVYQDAQGKQLLQPKMQKAGRVAISQSFADKLSEWKEQATDAYVWPGREGGPMAPSSISHLVSRLQKKAGLIDSQGRHIANLHGLRHSAGSIALSQGVPLTIVSASLRHSKPDFTARVYSHILGDDELDRFADAHTLRDALREGENPTISRDKEHCSQARGRGFEPRRPL